MLNAALLRGFATLGWIVRLSSPAGEEPDLKACSLSIGTTASAEAKIATL